MAKTLLELTQNILSAMNSDEVNSIYDTVESLQVATIILETIEAEFNNVDLPELNTIIRLQDISDLTRPNALLYGDTVGTISSLRYRDNRNSGKYAEVQYVAPADFFDYQLQFTSSGPSTSLITDPSGVSYYIRTRSVPHFYTSIDNKTLIFDSYDSDYENTLHSNNVFAMAGLIIPSGSLNDSYVAPIPTSAFPLLLAEAKSVCFITLKQMANPKSEQVARRQRSRMQHNLYKTTKANNQDARSKFNFARNR